MRIDKTNTLRIRTPEGIEFALPLAGPFARFCAWAVDGLIILLLRVAAIQTLGAVFALTPGVFFGLSLVVSAFLWITYGVLLEWLLRGQTVGKRLFRLRVADARGLNLRLQQILVRNLLRVIDNLPLLYLVGGASCVLSAKAQRLGDIAADTIVVHIPVTRTPDPADIGPGKYNSFREHGHLVARLRQQVTPREADLALRALLRRNTLEPESRVSLFRLLADHLRTTVRFPQSATDGLSDERYVRNVVDIVYSDRARTRERDGRADMRESD